MFHFALISASVREGRKSHRVALYLKNYIEQNNIGTIEILDLNEYQFPLFNERLRFQKSPSSKTLEFSEKVKSADGVIIVTPEYNGGYPASLKNVIDLLYDEWYHKPVAIATVSEGDFGGAQVITSLQYVLWKIKALTVTATFPVPKVKEAFDEQGVPANKEGMDKLAATFTREMLWMIDAAAQKKLSAAK